MHIVSIDTDLIPKLNESVVTDCKSIVKFYPMNIQHDNPQVCSTCRLLHATKEAKHTFVCR